jgi:hypothetical protein
MVYINDQPVGELDCQHRISVKAFSEGNLRLTVKWVPDKIYTEKKIGKHLHIGNPLDLEVKHGGNYYLHLALNENTHVGKINLTAYLVNYPESESIFKDEHRYKKYPEIKGFAEDPNNPYIKKSE